MEGKDGKGGTKNACAEYALLRGSGGMLHIKIQKINHLRLNLVQFVVGIYIE